MKYTKQDLIDINRQMIGKPVQVTNWFGYGVVVDAKDENIFLVENKYGETKEVDKFYVRSLSQQEIDEYFKPSFDISKENADLITV